MTAYVLPVVVALFVWWFSTGIILLIFTKPIKKLMGGVD